MSGKTVSLETYIFHAHPNFDDEPTSKVSYQTIKLFLAGYAYVMVTNNQQAYMIHLTRYGFPDQEPMRRWFRAYISLNPLYEQYHENRMTANMNAHLDNNPDILQRLLEAVFSRRNYAQTNDPGVISTAREHIVNTLVRGYQRCPGPMFAYLDEIWHDQSQILRSLFDTFCRTLRFPLVISPNPSIVDADPNIPPQVIMIRTREELFQFLYALATVPQVVEPDPFIDSLSFDFDHVPDQDFDLANF